jgi:chromosome segregation ATPase
MRARERLLAQGAYPSIDAVRAELGNTGSKTTIHRYLKEIEEEDGGSAGTKVAVSEAVQDLVGRLAGRLHEEADTRIAEAAAKFREQIENQNERTTVAEKEANSFRLQLEHSQISLNEEESRHQKTRSELTAESLERAKLAQQVSDLQELLKTEAAHRESLEEKHQHAREALAHFRQSIKEQRDQEQRQHEQQVQYLQSEIRTLNQSLAEKQHEVIHANQEGVRLTNDLARTETSLHNAQNELRTLTGVRDQFASSERNAETLGRRIAEQESLIRDLTAGKVALQSQFDLLSKQTRQFEIDLAAAKATNAAQDQITEKIHALIALATPSEKPSSAKRRSESKTDQETLFKG